MFGWNFTQGVALGYYISRLWRSQRICWNYWTDKMGIAAKSKLEKARLIILPSLLAALLGFALSTNTIHQPAQAFSSGPPPGYTRAPGEEPEACAECHVTAEAGTGQISIE